MSSMSISVHFPGFLRTDSVNSPSEKIHILGSVEGTYLILSTNVSKSAWSKDEFLKLHSPTSKNLHFHIHCLPCDLDRFAGIRSGLLYILICRIIRTYNTRTLPLHNLKNFMYFFHFFSRDSPESRRNHACPPFRFRCRTLHPDRTLLMTAESPAETEQPLTHRSEAVLFQILPQRHCMFRIPAAVLPAGTAAVPEQGRRLSGLLSSPGIRAHASTVPGQS